ncbi:hypothetical protein FB451DRAFT_1365359, partial [Mycena latifolia]
RTLPSLSIKGTFQPSLCTQCLPRRYPSEPRERPLHCALCIFHPPHAPPPLTPSLPSSTSSTSPPASAHRAHSHASTQSRRAPRHLPASPVARLLWCSPTPSYSKVPPAGAPSYEATTSSRSRHITRARARVHNPLLRCLTAPHVSRDDRPPRKNRDPPCSPSARLQRRQRRSPSVSYSLDPPIALYI